MHKRTVGDPTQDEIEALRKRARHLEATRAARAVQPRDRCHACAGKLAPGAEHRCPDDAAQAAYERDHSAARLG
jgi:hypothetical protein